MLENREEFVNFLIRAKQNTYAGDGVLVESSRPESKDLHHQEGELLYIDTYLGSSDFIGEEAVWRGEKAVWGMNYYGKMLVEDAPEGFIDCLKKALIQVPKEAPYRGPEYFKFKEFEYFCSWEGDLLDFKGEEYIKLNEKIIYKLSFHGGSIV